MAVRVDGKPSVADQEGDVSHCVSSLIQAFSNGINIFKRLRERREKRKVRKQTQALESANNAELQLSNSLRRGPMELAEKYDECYMQRNMGRRFARGDREFALEAVMPRDSDSHYSDCAFISCRNFDQTQHWVSRHHRSVSQPRFLRRKRRRKQSQVGLQVFDQLVGRLTQRRAAEHDIAIRTPQPNTASITTKFVRKMWKCESFRLLGQK